VKVGSVVMWVEGAGCHAAMLVRIPDEADAGAVRCPACAKAAKEQETG
jgi:hypothetical protein